jgi:hypothetical protein
MIYSVLKNLDIESPHIIACIESLQSLFRFLVMTSPALENICSLEHLFPEYWVYKWGNIVLCVQHIIYSITSTSESSKAISK